MHLPAGRLEASITDASTSGTNECCTRDPVWRATGAQLQVVMVVDPSATRKPENQTAKV